MALVTGQVVFEQKPQFNKALLTVKLEDVSLMDSTSQVIASITRVVTTNDNLAFELLPNGDSAEINPRSSYTVRAHVSLHPDDDPSDIREGDYLTMQSYPVLTQGNPSRVDVEVRRIG